MPDSDLNNSPQKPEGNTIKNNGLVGVTNLGGTQNFFGDVNITLTQGYKKSLDTVTLKPVAIFVNVEEQAPHLASIKNSDLLLELVYDPHINKDNPKRLRKLWVTLVQCSGAIIFIDEKLDDVIIEMVILACWLNHTNRKKFNLPHTDESRFILQFVGYSEHLDALLKHDKIKSNMALKAIISSNFIQKNNGDSKDKLIEYLDKKKFKSSTVNNKFLITSLNEYVDKLVDPSKSEWLNSWFTVINNILEDFGDNHILPSQFTLQNINDVLKKGNFDEKLRGLLGFKVQLGIPIPTVMSRLIMTELLNHGFLYFRDDDIHVLMLEVQEQEEQKNFAKFLASLCVNPLEAANIWFAINNFNDTQNIFNIATDDINRTIHHLRLSIFQPKEQKGFLFTNDSTMPNYSDLHGKRFLWNIIPLETNDNNQMNTLKNIVSALSLVSGMVTKIKTPLVSNKNFQLIEKELKEAKKPPKIIFLIENNPDLTESSDTLPDTTRFTTEEFISDLCSEWDFLNNCFFCIYGSSESFVQSRQKTFGLSNTYDEEIKELYYDYDHLLRETK